ncbi:hypothetical protein KSP39_PZI014713 [Platanthera zijinensis]|uniref:Uncharacterized protein n=1 Tax=Platanthera zijinensis TaxID=2320716 RepID=A0AAP0G277_9ASPA
MIPLRLRLWLRLRPTLPDVPSPITATEQSEQPNKGEIGNNRTIVSRFHVFSSLPFNFHRASHRYDRCTKINHTQVYNIPFCLHKNGRLVQEILKHDFSSSRLQSMIFLRAYFTHTKHVSWMWLEDC